MSTEYLEAVAAGRPSMDDATPDNGPYAGAVDDETSAHMQRVAAATLTPAQLATWQALCAGLPIAEIARRAGRGRQAVSQSIHGAKREPGIMAKMAAALRADADFMAAAGAALEPEPEAQPLAHWFIPCVPKPQNLLAYLVLLVAHLSADSKRRVRFDTLLGLMPRVQLEQGLHTARGMGLIMWDGVEVEIRSTPVDPQEPSNV